MDALTAYWSFIWDVYLRALDVGTGVGGIGAVLIYVLVTVVALIIGVVAPLVVLVQLVIFVAAIALKLAVLGFVIWLAITIFTTDTPQNGASSAAAHEPTAPAIDNVPSQTDRNAQAQEVNAVIEAAARYAQGIACEVQAITPDEVVLLAGDPSDEAAGYGPRFAVLWTGDVGCQGGSGTTMTNIAIVHGRGMEQRDYYVDALRSSPAIDFESPVRAVERIVRHGPDELELEGLMQGDSDPNCCPSEPVRFTLRADEAGHWKLIAQQALPPAEE